MDIQAVETDFSEKIDIKKNIVIKGARVNNLKNISLILPRNKLIVITGVSGSGKSSLAFDTLFAEGQRMYVESLSSYARQFLGRMEKPDVDYIKGISPAIAVEQKVNTRNPRSTVGTTTEIYDYLKLLFARIGKTISPVSGEEVKKNTVQDVINFLLSFETGSKYLILFKLHLHENRTVQDELKILLQKGYTRAKIAEEIFFIEELTEKNSLSPDNIFILVERGNIENTEEKIFQWGDAVSTAFYEGLGECVAEVKSNEKHELGIFSDRFELDGILFEEPNVNFFSFNNPYGACKLCEGFGKTLAIDPKLVIPDRNLSVYEGAVAAWQGEITRETWLKPFIADADKVNFPIHRPITLLTDAEYHLLWNGSAHLQGINQFFDYLENNLQKIQNRVMLSRFKSKQECPDCMGSRIRKDAHFVKINNNSIGDLLKLSTDKLFEFIGNIRLNEHEAQVAKIILTEISNRLHYLREVGLGYLNMNRLTSTLSGGEFQRIKLATSLGSALVGSMYILDEPSIGLHPRDTANLVRVLKKLRDLGNTVIVVEHEAEVMRAADFIADIGPDAGENGGYLVAAGTPEEVLQNENSYTGKFLKGELFIPIPSQRRNCNTFIEVKGASENNLKNIDVKFPLNALTVVTGVSGSGKSTLVKKTLYYALCRKLGVTTDESSDYSVLSGAINKISSVEMIDQNPIGRSSRSNPITYLKAYDHIRSLFAQQPNASANGLDAGSFSFNVEGGRCEPCQGEGYITIEMQFMADVRLQCEHCKGKRFQNHVLEVKYAEKNISEVLEMTVDDALLFFADKSNIKDKLQALQDTGLGYVRLGQSSATLSGGEAQRLKLANFLAKGESINKRILFIFDEPTTGLHFKDIEKLLNAINALIDNGHSVIIIEHNLEVIKTADYIIDLGPDGGENGGNLCFEGTPEEMLAFAESNLTAKYLAKEMNKKNQTV